MPENSCLNCRWADWQMTKHTPPKINGRAPGRCRCPQENYTIIVPAAITSSFSWRIITSNMADALWKEDAFTDCPLWEAG